MREPTPPARKQKVSNIEEDSATTFKSRLAQMPATRPSSVDISSMKAGIDDLLKVSAFTPQHRYWLDTGSRELNASLGSPKRGLAYGKIVELRGREHGGKTLLATILAGIAQKDGAAIGYIDLEDSRDPLWASKLGLNFEDVYPIWARIVNKKVEVKKKKKQVVCLQSAEDLFLEAEEAMLSFFKQGFQKQFWILDSVASIQTEMAVLAGTDWNMRVTNDRAMFLSQTLPRWTGLCANYNAALILVNQLRTKPGIAFGNPEYSPGGRALNHACAVRADVRRVKNGRVTQAGKTVGILSLVSNFKNKAGRGSLEGDVAAFKVRWDSPKARIKFMSKEDAEA